MTAAKTRSGRVYVAGVLLVVGALVVVGLLAAARARAARSEGERREAELRQGARTMVMRAKKGQPGHTMSLQGEARPYATVTLYAKVSGYLRSISVDRGARVKPNQVLAVIENPELSRQVDAAKADATFRRANAKRVAALAGPGVVSVSEAELEASRAQVAEANVAALTSQQAYTVLRAPFAGTVTARYADPGALVQSAANAQSGALPVVTVSQIDRLRVFLYVDQRDANLVHAGDAATVVVPESGLRLEARVARTAGELDPRTRTMLTEIELDNRNGAIVAGSFVTVELTVQGEPLIELPSEALVVRGGKTLVGVVTGATGAAHVQLRPVTVATNDGSVVRVRQGLAEGELVALNVGRGVGDGDPVIPIVLADPNAKPAK